MSDYSVVASDRSESFGTFDKYEPAIALYKKLEKSRSVGLTCLHACGCLYRAIMKGGLAYNIVLDIAVTVDRRHTGWRRAEACEKHRRSPPMKKRAQTSYGRTSETGSNADG